VIISHLSLLNLSGGHIRIDDRTAARPVVQSPTATNAHDPVTSERGGLSPYRAVEPWLLLLLSRFGIEFKEQKILFSDIVTKTRDNNSKYFAEAKYLGRRVSK
jgi:hypothetical protein